MLRRIGSFLLVASALFVVHQWATWPEVAALARERPTTTAFIQRYEARRGPGEPVAWRWVGYEEISEDLKLAAVAAEDIGFFDHSGFALEEIEAALRQAWNERRPPRGASTITQQVAKNLWLSPSRNPWRKVKEALLTRQLESRLSKRRILEIYLNVAQLGPGLFGVEAASRHYFGRPASAIGPRHAAELAATLPRPSTWAPGCGLPGYERYVATIQARVRSAAWLRGNL